LRQVSAGLQVFWTSPWARNL